MLFAVSKPKLARKPHFVVSIRSESASELLNLLQKPNCQVAREFLSKYKRDVFDMY